MRTVIFIPPLPRMSGGLAVLYQLARLLAEQGRETALTSSLPPEEVPGLKEVLAEGFTLLPWPKPGLRPDDCYVTPEGWLNALAPGLEAGARCVVYVQNWSFLLSGLPTGVDLKKLPLSFIAVSHPVACFLESMLELPVVGIIPPAVDTQRFRPGEKPCDHLRVAWMPRKNKAMGEEIRRLVEAVLPRWEQPPRLVWVPLHQLSPQEVAREMGRSHIFLATGFPEGCPLPPLEAMASGCLVVGGSGFGGWDYMRDAKPGGNEAWPAWISPPDARAKSPEDASFSSCGNGFFQADGDTLGTARALLQGLRLWTGAPAPGWPELSKILEAAGSTAAAYTKTRQAEAVASLWRALAASGRGL